MSNTLKELMDHHEGWGKHDWMEEAARLTDEIRRLREALDPGEAPCGCCELNEYNGKTFWAKDCCCGNYDDSGRAQSWCDDANRFAALESTASTDQET